MFDFPGVSMERSNGQVDRQEGQQSLEPEGLIDELLNRRGSMLRLVDRPPGQYPADR